MLNDSIVIIPTYKEKENIESIIRYVFQLPVEFHVLIIDDNSPDGTAAIVKKLMEEFPMRLFLIERPGKLGLGTAYIRGFQWALEHSYRYIFEMDADFSHNPDDLVRLRDAAVNEGADLVVGSRYVSGINVVNWPLKRVLMSYFASIYVSMVTGMRVHDSTAGFVCYTDRVLKAIDFSKIHMKGYGFQIEMKFTAWRKKFNIKEVSIVFIDRQKGTSKMSGGIFGEALFGVIKMKWRSFFSKNN
ncbi:MAG TPA: polyprenol monophosphomannose synthase [Prolixibacteraceae bacterium]|nr:polyprenol monophosphomannose synthase [Prolixibacteraceae bacterium]HPS13149.1 polyprenol monophosphomannose synthase [Prolixibacteraceae bacterium]